MKKKMTVGVLMGGRSSERAISLVTGEAVYTHLDRSKYIVKKIELTEKGRFVFIPEKGAKRTLDLLGNDRRFVDCMFIALHGSVGEDGAVQGLLEVLGIAYTGPNILASAIAMNKVRTADIYRAAGIATPDFVHFTKKEWAKNKTFEAMEDKDKPKFYPLVEFPYPSGAGLHVGHARPFTAMDVVARKRRMEGYNVLYPIGFDAFGLPTENFAIKTGRPPEEVTKENIANFTKQMKSLGLSFDWSRSVDTTNPKYYKWTQWIFLQLFKHGLAYKKNQPINWCPKDKIGLANEEVVSGCCERCGSVVEKRNKEQWILAITKYAEKLLDGLNEVDYIPQAKAQQENWIGKSEGAEVRFILNFKKNPKDNERRDADDLLALG
jgi:hypothetical protein